MAYGTGAERDRQTTSRTVSYGYGLDDIQRARESTERQSALGKFQLTKKFQDMARSMPGRFNQRGMIDSGLRKRAQERLAGQRLLEQYGLAAQTAEAQAQLEAAYSSWSYSYWEGTKKSWYWWCSRAVR